MGNVEKVEKNFHVYRDKFSLQLTNVQMNYVEPCYENNFMLVTYGLSLQTTFY